MENQNVYEIKVVVKEAKTQEGKPFNTFKVVQKDGKLVGRGVEDDQQGLVSQTFAALYYLENDIKPEHTIKLLFAAER